MKKITRTAIVVCFILAFVILTAGTAAATLAKSPWIIHVNADSATNLINLILFQ